MYRRKFLEQCGIGVIIAPAIGTLVRPNPIGHTPHWILASRAVFDTFEKFEDWFERTEPEQS